MSIITESFSLRLRIILLLPPCCALLLYMLMLSGYLNNMEYR